MKDDEDISQEILTLRWASAANPDFVARLAAIVEGLLDWIYLSLYHKTLNFNVNAKLDTRGTSTSFEFSV